MWMKNIFGQRLLKLRKTHKLTQCALAVQLGVSQTSINKYENGCDEPCYARLMRLAALLETTTDYLLGLAEHPQIPRKPDVILSEQEWELVEYFRQLPPKSQERALGYLQGAAGNK